jgi:hypothetical protein
MYGWNKWSCNLIVFFAMCLTIIFCEGCAEVLSIVWHPLLLKLAKIGALTPQE